MERAKRAIIVAAGEGKRLRPLTLETPKPLLTVNGKCIIDTLIDALRENGVDEIVVVVGYRADAFERHFAGQSGIILLRNPDYETTNNISSIYCARDYLGSCIIAEADLLVRNARLLCAEYGRSCYLARWEDNIENEWLLSLSEGLVTDCEITSGTGYQLTGVSFWTAKDGARLRGLVEDTYAKRQDIFWDSIALHLYKEQFKLGIREFKDKEEIKEIDSVKELAEIDNKYRSYL